MKKEKTVKRNIKCLVCTYISDGTCFSRDRPPSVHVKGKEIPLHAWTDPESSRRLRLPDFKTNGT
jgi:hypothetical protein